MSTISKEIFIQNVGIIPKDDDLERCNCLDAGKIGHYNCGWCKISELPRFLCIACFCGNPSHREVN
jgi:hypothetical protein